MKIGILVDSAATTDKEVVAGHDIDVLPLHIIDKQGNDILDTKAAVEEARVFERIKNGELFSTSQASRGEVEAKYLQMLNTYDHIIHIPIPRDLSSMLENAVLTAREPEFQGKVTVYENTTFCADAILDAAFILEATHQAEPDRSPQDLLVELDKFEASLDQWLIPGDLRNLVHGGRASKFAASALSLLRTKILLKWDKRPNVVMPSPTVGLLINKVAGAIKKKYDSGKYRCIVLRSMLADERIWNRVKDSFTKVKIKFTEGIFPTVYSVHAGINTIGFIFIRED